MIKVASVIILSTAVLWGPSRTSTAAARPTGDEPIGFTLILEQNATDGDAEVVLEVASEVALDRFALLDPALRAILALASDDGESLGLAEILLESAEPSVEQVLDAYPEGRYVAILRTTAGEWHVIDAELSHDLLPEPVILSPRKGQAVTPDGVVVTWGAIEGATSYSVEIEQDELGLSLNVALPATKTRFAVPDGFLVGGHEFEVGVAAEGENGNVIVVESSFDVE